MFDVPKNVIEVLFLYLHYFKKNNNKLKLKIWCPFENENSNFVILFQKKGFNVVFKNENVDFFDYNKLQIEKMKFDIIISMPPVNLKDDILERLYYFGVPFALLLPLITIDGKKRDFLFKNFDIELIRLTPKIKFSNFQKNHKYNFSYFCWKFIDEKEFRTFKLTLERL